MKALPSFFNNIKFRSKLSLSYIIIALIPLLIFSAVSSSVFFSYVQKGNIEHTAQMVEQVGNSIDLYISSIDKMAGLISCSLIESPEAFNRLNSISNIRQRDSLQNLLDNIAATHTEIAGVLIANSNNDYLSSGMSRKSRDPFSEEIWYQLALEHPDQIVLVNSVTGRNVETNENYSIDDVFSLARAIKNPTTNELLGVVLFDIRHYIIEEAITRITIGEKGFVFITDALNNIIYTPQNNIVYRVNPSWLNQTTKTPIQADISGGRFEIQWDQSSYTGWKTVGVFSLDETMAGVRSMLFILILCIMITVFAVFFVSFWVSRSVTRPILKLEKLMQVAESGNLSVRFNQKYEDEIGKLGKSFNHMLDRINSLIQMVYREQQSKRKAELKSLQEQIKPHFLYNTLDTINWMARDHEADDVVQLVDAMTSMFRIGLNNGNEIIRVEEELTHVSNYLYIQKIRYQSKLNYKIEVDPLYYDYLVPKLILQPLVENAIYHGIKQKRGIGTISISATLSDETLCFIVQDDGAGMNLTQLNALNEEMNSKNEWNEKFGFGLYYIRERIRIHYGENYGVTIDSSIQNGTQVKISLHAQTKNGQMGDYYV